MLRLSSAVASSRQSGELGTNQDEAPCGSAPKNDERLANCRRAANLAACNMRHEKPARSFDSDTGHAEAAPQRSDIPAGAVQPDSGSHRFLAAVAKGDSLCAGDFPP